MRGRHLLPTEISLLLYCIERWHHYGWFPRLTSTRIQETLHFVCWIRYFHYQLLAKAGLPSQLFLNYGCSLRGLSKRPSLYRLIHFYKRCVSLANALSAHEFFHGAMKPCLVPWKSKLAREVSPTMTRSDPLGYNLQSVICVAVGLQRWVIHAGWIGQPHLVLGAIASRPFG